MAGLKNGVERDVTEAMTKVCWVLSISEYTLHQKEQKYITIDLDLEIHFQSFLYVFFGMVFQSLTRNKPVHTHGGF